MEDVVNGEISLLVVMLSLQGFPRCTENVDPTKTWGYKSLKAVNLNLSCFAKIQQDSCSRADSGWRKTVLEQMGRAIRHACPRGSIYLR